MTSKQLSESIAEALDRLPSGSAYWKRVRSRLVRVGRDPQKFWPAYLAVIDAQQHDPVRQFAQEVVRSGVASEMRLPELIEARLAVPKQ